MIFPVLAFAVGALGLAICAAVYRIAFGPTNGNRVAAADLLTYSIIGLIAVTGARLDLADAAPGRGHRRRRRPRRPLRSHRTCARVSPASKARFVY